MRNAELPAPRQEEIIFPYDKAPRVYANFRIQAPRWMTPDEYESIKKILQEEIKKLEKN